MLHAATCLSMTHFINGHHCPNLAHQIVHQLHRLLTRLELDRLPKSREPYSPLLEHWQQIALQLLDQRSTSHARKAYH